MRGKKRDILLVNCSDSFVLSTRSAMVHFCSVTFNDTYRKYLLHIAENHPALGHTEDKKVFEMIGIDEAVGDYRSSIQPKGFMMRGIWYKYGFNHTHENTKVKTGGFIIAKHYSRRSEGKDGMFTAMRDAEKVVDEIIARMVKDSIEGHPLFYYSINDPSRFNIQPKFGAGESGYTGYLVTFQFSSHWNECAMDTWSTGDSDEWETPDGEAWSFHTETQWLDDGLTPKNL